MINKSINSMKSQQSYGQNLRYLKWKISSLSVEYAQANLNVKA